MTIYILKIIIMETHKDKLGDNGEADDKDLISTIYMIL